MKSIMVRYRSESQNLEFTNRRGEAVGTAVAPGRPGASPPGTDAVGQTLGSGTLIGYLSRAATETRQRLVILTVLTDSGEQVAGPLLSDLLDDDEAALIMHSAAGNDEPISTLRRFVRFRPDRGMLAPL